MKKYVPVVMAFALFFLFFIQMAGTLVQSIYVLDLMNLSMDARALGLLFFFSPVLLLLFRKGLSSWGIWVLAAALLVARGITPSLPTEGRLFTSGIAVGSWLLLFPFLLTVRGKASSQVSLGAAVPAGLALSAGLSVFLRTLDFSLDYSLTPGGAWAGWLLCLALALALTRLEWRSPRVGSSKSPGLTPAVIGMILLITLVYFAFSAPVVIARWTEANPAVIIGMVSLLSLASAFVFMEAPALLDRISSRSLIGWNILFALSLTATILAHRVSFPATPDSPAVAVGAPSLLQQIPLFLMLLLFPVIFLDMRLFFSKIKQAEPSPAAMAPGLLWGSLTLILLVFMNIFTNVWGYIQPVSPPFRNMFWLPFFLISAALCLIAWRLKDLKMEPVPIVGKRISFFWLSELAVIFAVTLFCALAAHRIQPADPNKTSLVVMTYNIQAGNDGFAQRSYDRQLEVIRGVSPDILALQETDTARISMNNDDYVRYFAGKLGYYSYYGPATVTGTFGTAILSKYPLQNTGSLFTYSDTDEIGTAEATIKVSGKVFHIHNVHPDGSPTAKLVFARTLVERSAGEANVIALGDFNLRENQEAYQVVAAQYTDAWKSLHPAEKGEGKGWIDHIFISPNLHAKDPTYLLPPASASDHPVHWTEISWEK